MSKFLFVPPVDDSLKPLTPWQWVMLCSSFLVSLAFFWLFMMAIPDHAIFAALLASAFGIVALPMQIYAQNRRGRLIGKLFLFIVWVVAYYIKQNWINAHRWELLFVALIVMSVYWIAHSIDQTGNMILKRLDVLKRRVNSVESKVDRMGRAERREENGKRLTPK